MTLSITPHCIFCWACRVKLNSFSSDMLLQCPVILHYRWVQHRGVHSSPIWPTFAPENWVIIGLDNVLVPSRHQSHYLDQHWLINNKIPSVIFKSKFLFKRSTARSLQFIHIYIEELKSSLFSIMPWCVCPAPSYFLMLTYHHEEDLE